MWEQRGLNRSEGASIVMRLEVRLSDMQPATIQNVDESEGVILSHKENAKGCYAAVER